MPDSIASPCNGICMIDERSGYCTGCLRSLQEIAAWPDLLPAAKINLLKILEMRRRGLMARYQPP